MRIDRPFDTFVFCDWSASSTPRSGRDSLWLCRAQKRSREVVNPRTRGEAEARLAGWLEAGARRGERILVGYDFPLGLPAISYAALGFRDWRGYWCYLARELRDGPRNENNRFDVALALNARAGQGPFWGAPARAQLTSTKPPADARFPDFREVEHVLRAKRRRPFSVWQLLGNGSVGSQSMVGIPMIQRLRQRPLLRACTSVWPFEDHDTQIVHAEAGPITIDVDLSRHPVRDAAQMLSLAAWAKRADVDGYLSATPRIARREGWVLGA